MHNDDEYNNTPFAYLSLFNIINNYSSSFVHLTDIQSLIDKLSKDEKLLLENVFRSVYDAGYEEGMYQASLL
jgi:flagellar biosynthesis component FlhA